MEVYKVIKDTGKVCTYQTEHLTVPSRRGNKYIMAMYVYDTDTIMMEPLKNRIVPEIT